MAEKRMFSNKITQSDPFLDMPATTQNLYFHLNMDADDEGFVNRTKSIMRMIRASEDDLKLLIAKNFIIPFYVENDNGINSVVVVIKHWFIHNTLRKDRMKYTNYTQQKNMIAQNENGAYSLLPLGDAQFDNQVATDCQRSVVEYSVVESSIDKYVQSDSDAQDNEQLVNKLFNLFWDKYPVKINKQRALINFIKANISESKLNDILMDIEKRKNTMQWSKKRFIPHPSNYIKDSRWLDEYQETEDDISSAITSSAVQPVYSDVDEAASNDDLEKFKINLKENLVNV